MSILHHDFYTQALSIGGCYCVHAQTFTERPPSLCEISWAAFAQLEPCLAQALTPLLFPTAPKHTASHLMGRELTLGFWSGSQLAEEDCRQTFLGA